MALARRLMVLAAAALLAITLSGCGKKDDLEPPSGEKSDYPKEYPR